MNDEDEINALEMEIVELKDILSTKQKLLRKKKKQMPKKKKVLMLRPVDPLALARKSDIQEQALDIVGHIRKETDAQESSLRVYLRTTNPTEFIPLSVFLATYNGINPLTPIRDIGARLWRTLLEPVISSVFKPGTVAFVTRSNKFYDGKKWPGPWLDFRNSDLK